MNLVFTSQLGNPLVGRNVLRSIQCASIRAGLESKGTGEKVGAHTLRHVVATRLLDGGVPMHVVSRVLGHDSIDTTVNTYGHMVDTGRRSALEMLSSPEFAR
jgi:site-specific recombinase XerD